MKWAKWQFGVFVLCIISMLLTGCAQKSNYEKGYVIGYERGYLEGSIDQITCVVENMINDSITSNDCMTMHICNNPLLPISREFRKCQE